MIKDRFRDEIKLYTIYKVLSIYFKPNTERNCQCFSELFCVKFSISLPEQNTKTLTHKQAHGTICFSVCFCNVLNEVNYLYVHNFIKSPNKQTLVPCNYLF